MVSTKERLHERRVLNYATAWALAQTAIELFIQALTSQDFSRTTISVFPFVHNLFVGIWWGIAFLLILSLIQKIRTYKAQPYLLSIALFVMGHILTNRLDVLFFFALIENIVYAIPFLIAGLCMDGFPAKRLPIRTATQGNNV